MRVGLATARALGFTTRRARRGRAPLCREPGEPRGASNSSSSGSSGSSVHHQTAAGRPRTRSTLTAPQQGRMFEDFVMSRSQLGAATVLASQIRLACSVGVSDFSLEVEGDGDDDDGT